MGELPKEAGRQAGARGSQRGRFPSGGEGGLTMTNEQVSGEDFVAEQEVEDAVQVEDAAAQVKAPKDEFVLIITTLDPDALDMAAGSIRESRVQGSDEIVLLPPPLPDDPP